MTTSKDKSFKRPFYAVVSSSRPDSESNADMPPIVGVAGFPAGFVVAKSGDVETDSAIENAWGRLSAVSTVNPESFPELKGMDPAVAAPLIALALLHGFGFTPSGMNTANWLAVPLAPPCDYNSGVVPLEGYSPPACVKTYPSEPDGVIAFLNRVRDIGLLKYLAGTSRDFSVLSAMIYPLPEFSGINPSEPISEDGYKVFRTSYWIALQKVWAKQVPGKDIPWKLSDFVPPFGIPSNSGVEALPGDEFQRAFTAATLLANAWNLQQMPLNTPEEGQTAIQAAVAMCSTFGDFGKVGQLETNNWFQAGDPTSDPSSCGPSESKIFNPIWGRCVYINQSPKQGANMVIASMSMSPKVKEVLLQGDLGKLAYAMMLDNLFAPKERTKEIWLAATKNMSEFLTGLLSKTGDVPRWKITDFVPAEFQGPVVQPPNPCKEGEELVNGVCVRKESGSGIDAENMPDQETSKKTSGWLYLLGATVVAGGVALWWKDKSKESEGYPQKSMWLHRGRRHSPSFVQFTERTPDESHTLMDVSFSEGERAIFEKMVSIGVLAPTSPTSSIWYTLPVVEVAEAQPEIHQMFSDVLANVPYDMDSGTVPKRVFERLDLFCKNLSLPFFIEANESVAEFISDLLISGIGVYPRYLSSVLYKSPEEYWYQALRLSLRTARLSGLIDAGTPELDSRLDVKSFRDWVSSNDTHELKAERRMFHLITQREYEFDLETHFSKLDRSQQFYRQIVSYLSPPDGVDDAISIVETLRFFENLARLAHLPNILHPFGYALELQGALDWSRNRTI